ncbi:hypothetical protein SELMODRAFT_446456 [Selaginella moellendorffii]|uniref:Uncharacterized protein n=1 Tax=Selaginella moellendorffii TaxID=88036 RepID=D8SRL8_SELML|nr:hypothetical protein SELMODRAFT_446456 [Selaginella moellendorffii]
MKNIEIHLVINAFSLVRWCSRCLNTSNEAGLTADKITYTTLMKALIRPEKLDEMEKQKTCFAFAVLSESLCHQKTGFCGEGVLDPWMFATFEAEKFLKAEEEEDSLGLILLQVKGWKKLGFLFKAHLFGSSPTHHPTYDNAHVLLRIGFFRLVPPAGVLDHPRQAQDFSWRSLLSTNSSWSSGSFVHAYELMRGGNRTVRSTMHVTHGPSMEREKQTQRKGRELKNAPWGGLFNIQLSSGHAREFYSGDRSKAREIIASHLRSGIRDYTLFQDVALHEIYRIYPIDKICLEEPWSGLVTGERRESSEGTGINNSCTGSPSPPPPLCIVDGDTKTREGEATPFDDREEQ